MHSFTDARGRDWSIEITVSAARRVRKLADVDLLAVLEGQVLERLAADPGLLCDVLFVLCQEQCREREITDEQFGEGLAGEAIEQAGKAFLDELVDFFPPARREVLRHVLARLEQLMGTAAEAACQRIDGPAMDRALEAAIRQADAKIDEELARLAATAGRPCEMACGSGSAS